MTTRLEIQIALRHSLGMEIGLDWVLFPKRLSSSRWAAQTLAQFHNISMQFAKKQSLNMPNIHQYAKNMQNMFNMQCIVHSGKWGQCTLQG
jgi:hypothetical protein